MKESTMTVVGLLALVIISLVAILGMIRSNAGATVLQSQYCQCSIHHLDYNGNPLGPPDLQHIRVRGEQYTPEYCDNLCDQHFGMYANAPNIQVTGTTAPMN